MKKIILGFIFVSIGILTLPVFGNKQTAEQIRMGQQQQQAESHITQFIAIISGIAYSDGYKAGYIQAAMDCAQHKGKPLDKKKVQK